MRAHCTARRDVILRCCVLVLVAGVVSVGWGQGGRGDVNGDGVVDARDALRVLQIAEGKIAPTDTDRLRGDVHPGPGAGEGTIGDGQLTREDAQALLRMLVGTATRGEVLGDYEAPVVEGLSPFSGPVGARVTVTGRNFLSGQAAAGKMLVLFGDAPAEFTPGTATQFEAVVPAGVTQAQVRVLTPGGEGRSASPFFVSETVTGRLELPAGVPVAGTSVESVVGQGSADGQGGFTAPTVPGRGTLVAAYPEGQSSRAYLQIVPPAGRRRDPVTLGARSTAEALILLQPIFATLDADVQTRFLSALQGVPEVAQLATVIEQVWPQAAEPLKDERVKTALALAVRAAAVVYPHTGTRSRAAGSFFLGDAAFLSVRFADEEKKELVVGLNFGSPVDHFVRVARLDPKGLPERMTDLKPENAYARAEFSDTTFAPATRVIDALLEEAKPRILDVIEQVQDPRGVLINEAAGTLLPEEATLNLAGDANAVYVVRAFSGVLYDASTGKVDSATIARLPLGTGDDVTALLMNLTLVAWEVASATVPQLGVLPGDLVVEILRAVVLELREALATLTGRAALTRSLDPNALSDKLYEIAAETVKKIYARLSAKLPNLAKVLADAVNVIDNASQIIGVVADAAPIAERIAGIAGLQIGGILADVQKLTPLETTFVTVGMPFGAVIDQFTPRKGLPGDQVTLRGIGFDSTPESNDVRFANLQAKVLSVKHEVQCSFGLGDEMVVEVPAGAAPGALALTVAVKGTRSRAADDSFTMLRAPVITGLSPALGYAAGGTWNGEPYPGTAVAIRGRNLGANWVGGKWSFDDKVYFQGASGLIEAPIIAKDDAGRRSDSTQFVVLTPAGATSGSVIVKTPEGYQSASPEPFRAVGPPTLTGITPDSAKSGGVLTLTGTNFVDVGGYGWLNVEFGYGGSTEAYAPEVLSDTTARCYLPGGVAEGAAAQIRVLTPAGATTTRSVTRVKGMEAGAYIGTQSDVAGIVPDGQISVEEAVGIAQGDVDPFANGLDDVDLDVAVTTTNRTTKDKDGNVTGSTSQTTATKTPRGTRGHAGDELAYVTHTTVEIVNGNETGRSTSEYTLSLETDWALSRDWGMPASAKVREEGDLLTSDRFGKSFADTVAVGWYGGPEVRALTIPASGAGGDLFQVQAPISGDVEVGSDGNAVQLGYQTYARGKVTVSGNGNTLLVWAGGGLQITGNDNKIEEVRLLNGASRLATGVRLTGGACRNNVVQNTIDNEGIGVNADVGLEISGGAHDNVVGVAMTHCGTGVLVSGPGTNANRINGWTNQCATGLEVSGGAAGNGLQLDIQNSQGTGAVFEGAGTERNKGENLSVHDSGSHGIYLRGGATANELSGTYERSKGYGVLIEGSGTSGNTVKGTLARNERGNAAVLGGAANTFDEVSFLSPPSSAPSVPLLLLQNLAPASGASVTIRNSTFGPNWDGPRTGPAVLLDNAGGALFEGCSWEPGDAYSGANGPGFSVGVRIQGAASRNNVLRSCKFLYCGNAVELLDKAGENLIESCRCPSSGFGVLIEGEASKNRVVGGLARGKTAGVMIRGKARGNTLHQVASVTSGSDVPSVVIEGEGTTGNGITGSELSFVVVRGGAASTSIGSSVPGMGNSFYADCAQPRILVQGAQTRDVAIYQNSLSWGNGGGILVEGAQNVRIGSSEGRARNTLNHINPWAIRVAGGTNVTIAGNEILGGRNNLSGVRQPLGLLVDGASDGVTIGGPEAADGNLFIDHATAAIQVTGADAKGVAILNNDIGGKSMLESATSAGSSSSTTYVSNNTGILLDGGCRGVRVSGNTVVFSPDQGAKVSGAGTSGHSFVDNTFAANGIGILIADGARATTLRGNLIYGNKGKAISLDGGNDGIAAPTFSSYVPVGNAVTGSAGSAVPTGSVVEIFGTHPRGQAPLGIAAVRPGGYFAARLPKSLPEGMQITGTLTDLAGNTSELASPFDPQGYSAQPYLTFTSTRTGNREVFRLFPGDSAPRQLTNDAAADHSPALSPNARSICWVSERAGNADLWIMASGGSGAWNVTGDSQAADYDPAWSPDSSKVAFVSERDGNPEIYTINLGNGVVTQLTKTEGVANRHPTWSPQGTSLLYSSGPAAGGPHDIWVIAADGTNPRNLTNSASNDVDPAWGAGTSGVAFVSDRDGNPEIYVMREDGTDVRRLTESPSTDTVPAWGASGIYFASDRGGKPDLYAILPDGSRLRQVTVSLGQNVQPNLGQQ